MTEKTYCPNCGYNVQYTIEKRNITSFRGVELNTFEYVAICEECEDDISICELDDENLKRFYREYKIATGMVLPEEIVRFREECDISGIELAAVLGWDKNSIYRYENGGLQPKSRDKELRSMIKNDWQLRGAASKAFEKERISKATYQRIFDRYTQAQSKKNRSPEQDKPNHISNTF